MEASFNPPRHLFKNHNNFNDRLETQHESFKGIATICDNLSECNTNCDNQAVISEKPKRKTKNTKQ